jgi:hypothetical protein
MATTNTVSVLDGFFKEVYADQIENLIPEGVVCYNMIKFSAEKKQLGNLYHQPVILGLEHGITYGGPDGEAFNLNASVAGVMKDAQVQGYEMVLRSTLSIAAASRAKGDSRSFGKATKHLISNMLRSFVRRLEVQIMYGQAATGIGKIAAGGVSGNVLTIDDKEWAPGIWAGAEGMEIDVYDVTGATFRGSAVISSVDFDNKAITVNLAPVGTVATDIFFYKGAKGNEFAGIDKIISNTGTLFNISASSYQLWRGNVLDNSGTGRDISLALIEDAVARAVEKGLADQDVIAIVNPNSWNTLLTEQTAKRMFDSSYSGMKMDNGAKEIEFYGQNGGIKIKPSIYCKAGSCYVFPPEEFMRVGSSDATFEQPGFEGQFFRLLNDANGYELRCYTDQALFCTAPGKCSILRDVEGA